MSHSTSPGLDVVTFGETMLRLSPPAGESLLWAGSLDLYVGGSESNVMAALSQMGLKTGWISRMVDNPVGKRVEAEIRKLGVDTSRIFWTKEGRNATMFIEVGVSPRKTSVIYDRKPSSASQLDSGCIGWDYLLSARLLHLTGITMALGPATYGLVIEAARRAREAGMRVSFDLNYRAKLWSQASASAAFDEVLRMADIVVGTDQDSRLLFPSEKEARSLAAAIAQKYGSRVVAITRGAEGALLLSDGEFLEVNGYPVTPVDRIGAGDCFTAGIIWGALAGDLGLGLRHGIAMAALKHTLRGDMLNVNMDEVADLVGGPGSNVDR